MQVVNPCIRCGTERVVIEEWEETTENGIKMKRSKSACPDQECQEEVNKMLMSQQNERARKEELRRQRLAKIHNASLEATLSI